MTSDLQTQPVSATESPAQIKTNSENPTPANQPMLSSNKGLNSEQVHNAITNRLKNNRPVAWEEDISRNALDTAPFENLAPMTERDAIEFSNPKRLATLNPMLGDTKLEDMIAKDAYPIPCPEDREGYAPGFDGPYWMSGLEDYLKIMDAAKRHGVEPKSVFDFGCASGRVLRHWAAQSDVPEIWGSDINRRHVRWLFENMPHTVKPIFNHCIPTIPIRDNSVDIISAFSVFTHIDTFETCWLAELRRIMSDDGMAYLTVHNEDTWAALREVVDDPKNRLVQSIKKIDPNFGELLKGDMPDTRTVYRFTESGPYRAQVFHSNNFLRQVWGRFFSVEEIIPLHHTRQTVLILRKK